MKATKKIIALVLCAVMSFSLVGTFSFADDADTVKYVAVGDSASMGYLMDDYTDDFQHNYNYNTQQTIANSSSYSVFSRFNEYLKSKGLNVEATDLSMTGMRTLEFRSILDESYFYEHEAEVQQYEENPETTFWGYHMWNYLYRSSAQGWGSYELLHNTYTEKLYDADIITLDLTMNDFGTYFGSRFIDINGKAYENDTFAKIMQDETAYPEVGAGAEALRVSLENLLADSGIPMETVDNYIDAVLYSYASFAINFSKAMDLIYKNNPDVEIIVNGPFNVMEGLTFTLGDIELDAELIWKLLNDAITAYICAVDSHKDQYKLADLSGGCEIFTTLLANANDISEVKGYPNEYMLRQFKHHLGINNILNSIPDAYDSTYETIMLNNLCKGAAFTTVPLTEVLALMGSPDASMVRALLNFNNDLSEDPIVKSATGGVATTDADRGLLHIAIHFAQAYALGAHPDAKGYDQKIAAVIKAYESDYTADGTYHVRGVETSISFAKAFINLLLGQPGAKETFKQMILDLFAPITKVFNLIGGFC